MADGHPRLSPGRGAPGPGLSPLPSGQGAQSCTQVFRAPAPNILKEGRKKGNIRECAGLRADKLSLNSHNHMG